MARLVGGGGWSPQTYTLAAYLVLIPFLLFNLFQFFGCEIDSFHGCLHSVSRCRRYDRHLMQFS